MNRQNEPSKSPRKGLFKGRLPINKGVEGQSERVLPQINNPLTIAALTVGAKTLRAATQNLRFSKRPGRNERFRLRLISSLRSTGLVAVSKEVKGMDVRVSVNEAFGKPTLVSVDLCMTPDHHQYLQGKIDDDPAHGHAFTALMSDLLERAVEQIWDNPEIAPVAVRGRLLTVDPAVKSANEELAAKKHLPTLIGFGRGKADESLGETVLLDMTDLGYEDEIARPTDLFENYGPPASDPTWRP